MNIEIEPAEFENFLKLFATGLMATFDMLPYLPPDERQKAAEALVQFREKVNEWQAMRNEDRLGVSREDVSEAPFYV
jgi:hypothetical protein